MREDTLISDEVRTMIGRQTAPETGYAVSEHEIRRYAYAIDDNNPLWTDSEYAKRGPYGGLIAPPFFHRVPFAADHAVDAISESGAPRDDSRQITPPLHGKRIMAGGLDVEFGEPIRPGDVLTRATRLADIYERQGKQGPMTFYVLETTYTNQRGETVAIEKKTAILR